jgi:hypothetical protein
MRVLRIKMDLHCHCFLLSLLLLPLLLWQCCLARMTAAARLRGVGHPLSLWDLHLRQINTHKEPRFRDQLPAIGTQWDELYAWQKTWDWETVLTVDLLSLVFYPDVKKALQNGKRGG